LIAPPCIQHIPSWSLSYFVYILSEVLINIDISHSVWSTHIYIYKDYYPKANCKRLLTTVLQIYHRLDTVLTYIGGHC
jgi:hypothetical protein